jgi:hypothetical protein
MKGKQAGQKQTKSPIFDPPLLNFSAFRVLRNSARRVFGPDLLFLLALALDVS